MVVTCPECNVKLADCRCKMAAMDGGRLCPKTDCNNFVRDAEAQFCSKCGTKLLPIQNASTDIANESKSEQNTYAATLVYPENSNLTSYGSENISISTNTNSIDEEKNEATHPDPDESSEIHSNMDETTLTSTDVANKIEMVEEITLSMDKAESQSHINPPRQSEENENVQSVGDNFVENEIGIYTTEESSLINSGHIQSTAFGDNATVTTTALTIPKLAEISLNTSVLHSNNELIKPEIENQIPVSEMNARERKDSLNESSMEVDSLVKTEQAESQNVANIYPTLPPLTDHPTYRTPVPYTKSITEKCRNIHFSVLVAPDFGFNPEIHHIYLMFGHHMLGNFERLRYKMKHLGNFKDEFALLALSVEIPMEITRTPYKYLRVHKQGMMVYEWEYLHYSSNAEENRMLDLTTCDNEAIFRYDNCIEPKKIEVKNINLLYKILKDVKSAALPRTESPTFAKINADICIAMKFFWPDFDTGKGFYSNYDQDMLCLTGTKLNVMQTIRRMDDVLKCFSNSFYYVTDSANNSEIWHIAFDFFLNLLADINDGINNFKQEERVEIGCVTLHLAYKISQEDKKFNTIPNLIQLCNLFVASIDEQCFHLQMKVLQKNDPRNRKVELSWLLKTLNLDPHSLIILPLINSLITNELYATSNVTDDYWWLPETLRLQNNQTEKFDWTIILSVLAQSSHYHLIDKHFAPYVLFYFCINPEDILKVWHICTPNLVLAWITFRIFKNSNLTKGEKCQEIADLLGQVRNSISLLQNVKNMLPDLLSTFSCLLELMLRFHWIHIGQENVLFLMNLVELSDTLISLCYQCTTITCDIINTLLELLHKLLLRNEGCFNLSYFYNETQWEDYIKFLLWKGKDQRVMDVWVTIITIPLEKLKNKEDRALIQLIKFYCSDQFDSVDERLTRHLEILALKFTERFLTRNKTTTTKWLQQIFDETINSVRFSNLISLSFVNLWPEGIRSDFDTLQHLLQFPLFNIYFNKLTGFVTIDSLTAECQKLIMETKRIFIEFKKFCLSLEIKLGQLKFIERYKDEFIDILRAVDDVVEQNGSVFPNFLNNLFNAMGQFAKYQGQLRVLFPFISHIEFKEKRHVCEVLALQFDNTLLSSICSVQENGLVINDLSLQHGLAQKVPVFESLKENNFFRHFWLERCKIITPKDENDDGASEIDLLDYSLSSLFENQNDDAITLAQIMDKIYHPAVEKMKHFVNSLMDMSIQITNLEEMLSFLVGDASLYLPDELTFVCSKILNYDHTWVKKFQEKLKLYDELVKSSTTNEVLHNLLKNLDLKNALNDLNRQSFVKGNKSDLKLMDIQEGLVKKAKKLKDFPRGHLDCLAAVNECWTLIEWARKKEEKDLPHFVEIALTNVGESDSDIAMITDFNNVIIGFNCLIFNIDNSLNLDYFIEHLDRLWESLNRNPNLDKQLKQSHQNLLKLDMLWNTIGDLQKTSLCQIEDINQKGIYKVGNIRNTELKKTLDNCIELEVSEENESLKKVYNLTDLRDLNSRVMLIGTQMDKGLKAKKDIEEFANKFDGISRLAQLYIKHYEAGNMLFIEWICFLDNDPDNIHQASCCFSADKTFLSGENDDHQIETLCSFFEIALKQWNEYVEKRRDEFFELNYFTNRQIEYLRKALAGIKNGVDKRATTMLLVLDQSITPKKIIDATYICMDTAADSEYDSQYMQLNEVEKAFIDSITDYQIEKKLAMSAAYQVEFSDVQDALDWATNNMDAHQGSQKSNANDLFFVDKMKEQIDEFQIKEEKLLASKLKILWNNHISKNESNNYAEFIGVHQLGCILRYLALHSPECPLTQLHGIKLNEPNLLLAPLADLYRFVLGLYTGVGGSSYFPSFKTVLMCNKETTEEDINLFIRRIKLSNCTSLFTMVDVDQLNSEVCTELEVILEDMKKSGCKFCFALIASEENFDTSHAANYLSRFKSKYTNPSSWIASQHMILQQLLCKMEHADIKIANIPPEFCLTYFKFAFFTSVGYGHGKSRIISIQKQALPDADLIKIPVHDDHLLAEEMYSCLEHHLIEPSIDKQRILHIDILNHKTTGVDKFLFQLFILGGFSTSDGAVWRLLPNDYYAIEMTTSPNQKLSMRTDVENLPIGIEFRFLLPTVLCHSPGTTLNLVRDLLAPNPHVINRSLDQEWIYNDFTQRCYQYLSAPKEMLQMLTFVPRIDGINCPDVLQVLLSNCGISDPSWAELQNFVKFLSPQIHCCEQTPFSCVRELPGFKTFAVMFMIKMSRDFSTRSLEIAEDVGSLIRDDFNVTEAYQIIKKQKWEVKAHPYLFFNEDSTTFSFFGCNITDNGDLIDPVNGKIIEKQIATPHLVRGLIHQGVDDLKIKFDSKSRLENIQKLCMVLGVDFRTDSKYSIDPDPTYEITSDCALKMLAIKMRMRCGIPVIIMGETGCGKTKLIQYLCDLERNCFLQEKIKPQNLIIVRVHGGTTKEHIKTEVNKAITLAKENQEKFPDMRNKSTVLFFDEANTTPAISLIKEIICDGTMNGEHLNLQRICLNVIAAVNPYRKHSKEMIDKLEKSGLGYHVSISKLTEKEKFGVSSDVPLRHLVYRVHPLPASMLPMVWDFGTLSNEVESLYIKQMVRRFLLSTESEFPADECTQNVLSNILSNSQTWMRNEQNDEAGFVSLRNVQRALNITEWFYTMKELFFKRSTHSDETLSVLLAICICYRCSIQSKRKNFDDFIIKFFDKPPLYLAQSDGIIEGEIRLCQETFLQDVNLPANIAKNEALRENVFLITICIELRIPLFLIGKPGSSKSLAKSVVSENMVALSSKSVVYQSLKQAVLNSYQCSPLATADGVETIFRRCARQQKDQNLDHYVAAAVFDEIGLAEDSPALPLKALHGFLETGCSINGEELTDSHRVGFVGISNWALDPAKMNRGIFVTRIDPTRKQLFQTAKRICNEGDKKSAFLLVQYLIRPVIEAYLEVCSTQTTSFFGLRDFYSLMKSLYEIAESKMKPPNYRQVIRAVRHNFSGQENFLALKIFDAKLGAHFTKLDDIHISAELLIEENLHGSGEKHHLNRYLLILSENYAAMRLIRKVKSLSKAEIIFGSSFPQDMEYTQVCRNINKIKVCMDKGRPIILLNLEQLYESLYDLLNQAFIQCSGENFVDLGLGTHRLKCHVHQNFRLVIVAEREDALNKFPFALLNRLEKHFVSTIDDPENYQIDIIDDLKAWAEDFSNCESLHVSRKLQPADTFIGYHEDTATAIISEICGRNGFVHCSNEEILLTGKEILLQSSTPDSVMRLRYTPLKPEMNFLLDTYFKKQYHASFVQYVQKNTLFEISNIIKLHQITTHSLLFSNNDNLNLANNLKLMDNLKITSDQITIVTVHMYNTEQEFSKRIRKVFESAVKSHQLLIVQCSSGDQNPKLIACCRYILENMTKLDEFSDCKLEIFLLISLPRTSSNRFTGFPNIPWQCSHIDELAPQASEIEDLTDLIGKSVSSLLDDFIKNKEEKTINFNLIINESLHLAASYIRDDTLRKLKRLNLIHNIWSENDRFRELTFIWMCQLLKEKEERMQNASDWIFYEATKTGIISEHRTYRQTLCKFMENLFVPLLSGLMTVFDHCDNLDLLMPDAKPVSTKASWVPSIWLQLFSDKNFLKIRYNSDIFIKTSTDGISSPRQEFTILSEMKFKLSVPFFWIIKNNVEDFLNELERTGNYSDKEREEHASQFLHQTAWGLAVSHLPKESFGLAYCHDFILSYYNAEHENDMTQLLMMWLAHFAKLDDGTNNISPIISCGIAHRRLARNMQLFRNITEIHPPIVGELMKSTDKFEKYFHSLDLLSVDQLIKIMEKYVENIDAVSKTNTVLTKDQKTMQKKTTLLTKEQKLNRSNFVTIVQNATMVVKSIFKKYDLEHDLHPAILQLLQRLKNEWFAAEMSCSFLYHTKVIAYPLNVKALWKDNKGNEFGLNSVKFWKGLERFMRIWTQLLFDHYFNSTKLDCVICDKLMSIRPIVLPCMHIIHEKCFNRVFIELAAISCPKCNARVSKESDKELRFKTDQYTFDREALTQFFLDLVCELFNGESPPLIDVLQILLSYVTQSSEDRMTTSQISPFPDSDAIDSSPVIRSFLLQLILNQNLTLVLDHIDAYLNTGRKLLNNDESLQEFLWLCVCCTEDSFHWKSVRACGLQLETEFIDFVFRNIPDPFQLRDLHNFSASDIECLAKCRFVLSSFVDIIVESESILETDKVNAFNNRVKMLVTESEDKRKLHFLLLKLFCLRYGIEFARKLLSKKSLEWIVGSIPLGDVDVPDPFVIYGKPYMDIKDSIYESIFHNELSFSQQNLQGLAASNEAMSDFYICCSIQQWLTSTHNVNINEEKRNTLNLISEKISSPALRKVMDQILSESYLEKIISATNSVSITALLFHFNCTLMYLPCTGVAAFFQTLLISPGKLRGLLFPTMPEQDFDQTMFNLLTQQIGTTVNECPKGHLYVIGDCGKPMVEAICIECKETIGGRAHVYSGENTNLTAAEDRTKRGHCLGNITQMGTDIYPERNLDRLSTALCRFLVHCAMFLSSLNNANLIAELVVPTVNVEQLNNFCFDHFIRDLNLLSKLLTVSSESVINLIHTLLNRWVENGRGCLSEQNLTTKEGRRLWEDCFHGEILAPILSNSASLIAECDTLLANKGTQNKFYAQIYEPVQPNDYLNLFWSYRPPTSFESLLTTVMSQLSSKNDSNLIIMGEFLKQINYLNSLQHLPSIVNLHKEMRIRLGSIVNLSEIQHMTIKKFLSTQTDCEKLQPLIESFFAALKIMEPKLNNFKFSLKTKEISKDGNKIVFSDKIISIEKWMVPNLKEPLNNSLTSILPMAFKQGYCSCALIELLIGEQNKFTAFRSKILGITEQTKHLDEALSDQMLNFDSDRDIYPLLMLHRNFSYNLQSKPTDFFDLRRLNKRLEQFYNKDIILFQNYTPLFKTRETLLFACMKRLRLRSSEFLLQNSISASQKRDILRALMNKSAETRILLDTIEKLIRFSVSVDHYDEQILKFSENIHCLPSDSFILKILNGFSLAHLPSLWQLTAFYSKYLRMNSSEDPFPEVDENCKTRLSSDETKILLNNCLTMDLLQFLLETTEFLLLYLSLGASGLDSLRDVSQTTNSSDEIYESELEPYLLYRNECQLKDAKLDECLKLKHTVTIWKLAAKWFAQSSEK